MKSEKHKDGKITLDLPEELEAVKLAKNLFRARIGGKKQDE